MTNLPMIVIPDDAAARIRATVQRKQDEMHEALRKSAEERIASGITVSDPKQVVVIRTASDARRTEVETAACDVYYGFFDGEQKIDWYAFFDRLEQYGYSVETTESPAARKIQRFVRRIRDEER